jgi:hypothetical protein
VHSCSSGRCTFTPARSGPCSAGTIIARCTTLLLRRGACCKTSIMALRNGAAFLDPLLVSSLPTRPTLSKRLTRECRIVAASSCRNRDGTWPRSRRWISGRPQFGHVAPSCRSPSELNGRNGSRSAQPRAERACVRPYRAAVAEQFAARPRLTRLRLPSARSPSGRAPAAWRRRPRATRCRACTRGVADARPPGARW